MSPLTLFHLGYNTIAIANLLNISEAEAYNAIYAEKEQLRLDEKRKDRLAYSRAYSFKARDRRRHMREAVS